MPRYTTTGFWNNRHVAFLLLFSYSLEFGIWKKIRQCSQGNDSCCGSMVMSVYMSNHINSSIIVGIIILFWNYTLHPKNQLQSLRVSVLRSIKKFILFPLRPTICSPLTFYFGKRGSEWAKVCIFIWFLVHAEPRNVHAISTLKLLSLVWHHTCVTE